MLLMCIVALGDSGAFLQRSKARQWQSVGWQLIIARHYLMANTWTAQMCNAWAKLVPSLMDDFKAVVGAARATETDLHGVGFPKFHLMLHYLAFITEYGPPVLCYGALYESALKHFCKRPAERTQRRLGSVVTQVAPQCRVGHGCGGGCIPEYCRRLRTGSDTSAL